MSSFLLTFANGATFAVHQRPLLFWAAQLWAVLFWVRALAVKAAVVARAARATHGIEGGTVRDDGPESSTFSFNTKKIILKLVW